MKWNISLFILAHTSPAGVLHLNLLRFIILPTDIALIAKTFNGLCDFHHVLLLSSNNTNYSHVTSIGTCADKSSYAQAAFISGLFNQEPKIINLLNCIFDNPFTSFLLKPQ